MSGSPTRSPVYQWSLMYRKRIFNIFDNSTQIRNAAKNLISWASSTVLRAAAVANCVGDATIVRTMPD
jgi:hypothetical protein